MGTASVPGVKRPVRDVDHPHLPPTLKKEWSYTSTPPLGLCGMFVGEPYGGQHHVQNYMSVQCTESGGV